MEWTRRILRDWLVQAPLFAAIALTAGAVHAQGTAQVPSVPEPDTVLVGEPAAAEAAPAVEERGPQPPDGKWLTDKEGRKYFLEKFDKSMRYRRLDEKMVRTPWGISIEVEKEDEKFFYYKVYQLDPNARADFGLRPKPTAEEEKRVLDSYEVKVPESRRLTFSPFSKGLPTSGQWRNGFEIADMNGDKHPDIVHGPARKSLGPPSIFLGDGKGSWRRWQEAKYPRLPFDYGDAAAADFNGDGHLDLALGMHLRGLVALLGDGKGNFTDWGKGLDLQVPGRDGNDASGFSSRTIATTDWNGDGRMDIVAMGEGPRLNVTGRGGAKPAGSGSYGIAVYLNQGDGSWVRKDQGTSGREIFGEALALADFNGDRRKDIATGSSVMGRRTLVNFGREDGAWNVTEVEQVRPQSYIRAVTTADFNGDGADDLAIGYLSFELATWRSGIDILYGGAGGAFTRRALAVQEGRLEFSALSSGDLDGDGKLDLAALTGKG
ncbi:MAG TPA: VCBS repeat-containing protein, partial [Thermoanaerobaculia bacterium]|nr:VCBS repeat-containing protein [Thermoanaerobaculia bacterium]